jgi:ankyrin repeat protein
VYQTSGRHHRLAIHEVCKIIVFPNTPENEGEISDDEDDDDADAHGSGACHECMKSDNMHLCQLVGLMIDASHRMGPVRVLIPREESDSDVQQSAEEQFQIHESILTVSDHLGKTPLHVLCENAADTEMLRALFSRTRENTENPCAPTALSLITAKDANGSTPLHYLAYSRLCPYASLKLMMDYSKAQHDQETLDPTMCTDMDGDTPLHWALDGYMSPRRVKELIRYHKKAIWITNTLGRRPMDQFVENFVDTDWYLHEMCGREVWENIQGYLRVMREDEESKEEEWFPVHVMAGSSIDFPSKFLDIALHYNKDDLSKPNAQGLLPLHLACARKSQSSDGSGAGTIAAKMLQLYPQAAYKIAAETKRLPIHIAIDSKKPLSVIASLLKVYPNSLNIPDPISCLWPFLLAGSNDADDINASYCLLRADPSIVQVTIRALLIKCGERASQAIQNMDPYLLEAQESSRTLRKLCLGDEEYDGYGQHNRAA